MQHQHAHAAGYIVLVGIYADDSILQLGLHLPAERVWLRACDPAGVHLAEHVLL